MNREEVLAQLKQDTLLSQMYKVDQKKADDVIDYLLQCTDPFFGLVYHDVLAKMIIGFTPSHLISDQQRALMAFADQLLPNMPDEEEDYEVICDDGCVLWIE